MDVTPAEYLLAIDQGTVHCRPELRALSLSDPNYRPPGSLGAQIWALVERLVRDNPYDEDDETADEVERKFRLLETLYGDRLSLDLWPMLTENYHDLLLAAKAVSCDERWMRRMEEIDDCFRVGLSRLLEETCQTDKCRALWTRYPGACGRYINVSDWATWLVRMEVCGTTLEEVEIDFELPIRECVVRGLAESGVRLHLPVYRLPPVTMDVETVVRCLRADILQLTDLDVPSWMSPENRERWRELDTLVPGWDRGQCQSLLEAYQRSGEYRAQFKWSLEWPGDMSHHQGWLTSNQTIGDYLAKSYKGIADLAYILLYGECRLDGQGYVFGVGNVDACSRCSDETLVIWGRGGATRLALGRETVEEVLLPLRESWQFQSSAKSARSGRGC